MHFLAVLAAVLTRLTVWLLLLVKWSVDFLWAALLACVKAALYLARLVIGTVLRPMSHRFALIAVAIVVIVIAASDPRLRNPGFYGVVAVAVLGSFFAGRIARLLMPRTAPSFGGMFPALPGWPTWPPVPKPRPRVKKPGREPEIIPPGPGPEPASHRMPVQERPAPSAVFVVASSPLSAPSEQEAITALPEALQRLMQPKADPPSAGPTAQDPSA